MNIFIAILVIFGTVVGVLGDSSDCSMECPQLLSPTCGTDGHIFRQFDNECLLNVFNCERQKASLRSYRKADIDWCTTTEVDDDDSASDDDDDEDVTADPSCMKVCPMIYEPVCGSNGTFRRTFANRCMLDLYNCYKKTNNQSWRVLRRGGC